MITPERRAYLESLSTDNPLPYVPPMGPFGAIKRGIATASTLVTNTLAIGSRKKNPAPTASAPPPLPSVKPTSSPSAAIPKPSIAPAPMKTPALSTLKPATSAKADPLADVKFMQRDRFESLSFEDRDKFMVNGGHLVDMKEHESPKHAAERNIKFVNDTPEVVAESLIKGWGLSTEDTTRLVLAKFTGKYDAKSFGLHTEASLKEAVARAEKSNRPVGYLLPGAQPVDKSRHDPSRRHLANFKRPGEVSEPDRLAAENELMRLYAEFEKVMDDMVRVVWWEKHRDEVFANAVNETKRGPQWLGVFIGRLPNNLNAHLFKV
jgi:hypothetical protein